jgi:sugar/nucleoside kinase (ribokinase family)
MEQAIAQEKEVAATTWYEPRVVQQGAAHPGVEHQGPSEELGDDAGAGDAFHASGAAAVVAQMVHYEQNSIADDSSVAA